MRPDTLEEVGRCVRRDAGGEPDVLRRDFHHSLCAAYTPAEVRRQFQAAGLQDLEIQAVSDRHWVVRGRMAG